MRSISLELVAYASVALLAACSDGGGGDPVSPKAAPVSLITKADVVREIGNFAVLQGDSQAEAAAFSAQARRSGAQRLVSMGASPQAGGNRAKGGYVPALETYPCDSGSVTYEDFTGVARNYPLFGVTPPSTDYSVLQFLDCVDHYDSWTYTTDGRVETGDSASTAQTPAYSYELLGSGSTPYTHSARDSSTGDHYTTQVLGRFEARDDGAVWQSRENVTVMAQFPWGGDTFSMAAVIGEDGNPMVLTDAYGAGTLAIDGPFQYSTSFCEGGRMEVTTIEPLTFGSDDFGSFTNGGQLVIEAGGRSVTITFQGDGGASYQFNDGASGTITRDEMSSGSECQLSAP